MLSASAEAAIPTGLLVDFKRSPSLGVRLKPAFTWCATHRRQKRKKIRMQKATHVHSYMYPMYYSLKG